MVTSGASERQSRIKSERVERSGAEPEGQDLNIFDTEMNQRGGKGEVNVQRSSMQQISSR